MRTERIAFIRVCLDVSYSRLYMMQPHHRLVFLSKLGFSLTAPTTARLTGNGEFNAITIEQTRCLDEYQHDNGPRDLAKVMRQPDSLHSQVSGALCDKTRFPLGV